MLSFPAPVTAPGACAPAPAPTLASARPGRRAGPAQAPRSADWVARQVQDRDTGRDAALDIQMRLVDRHGRVRERALTIASLRGSTKPGAAPGAPPGDRLLIRFTAPGDIRGTSFLVWEHPAAEDERFLYLPALGRVRRIAGAESQQSFVGSDFTYEDIGGREFDDYTYAMLDGHASWRAPDGTAWPAYRIESRRKDREAVYPRVESLVLEDRFIVVHAEVFNRRDEREKTYAVRRLERVDGIWTAMEMTMANVLDDTRTDLLVSRARYNTGLTADHFTRRELERGGR